MQAMSFIAVITGLGKPHARKFYNTESPFLFVTFWIIHHTLNLKELETSNPNLQKKPTLIEFSATSEPLSTHPASLAGFLFDFIFLMYD